MPPRGSGTRGISHPQWQLLWETHTRGSFSQPGKVKDIWQLFLVRFSSVHFCSASVQISTSPATNQKCELKTQIQFEPKAVGENIANKEMSRRPAHHF